MRIHRFNENSNVMDSEEGDIRELLTMCDMDDIDYALTPRYHIGETEVIKVVGTSLAVKPIFAPYELIYLLEIPTLQTRDIQERIRYNSSMSEVLTRLDANYEIRMMSHTSNYIQINTGIKKPAQYPIEILDPFLKPLTDMTEIVQTEYTEQPENRVLLFLKCNDEVVDYLEKCNKKDAIITDDNGKEIIEARGIRHTMTEVYLYLKDPSPSVHISESRLDSYLMKQYFKKLCQK